MIKIITAIAEYITWLFRRLPSEGQSIRAEIDKLNREWDEIIAKKKATIKDMRRLITIAHRLRELYTKSANKVS